MPSEGSLLLLLLITKKTKANALSNRRCVVHTAWASEVRKRRSQEAQRASSQKSGPGGPLTSRLLVYIISIENESHLSALKWEYQIVLNVSKIISQSKRMSKFFSKPSDRLSQVLICWVPLISPQTISYLSTKQKLYFIGLPPPNPSWVVNPTS